MSDKDPAWENLGGGPPRQPKFVLQQVDGLNQLKALLEGIITQKQTEIGGLQEKLARLKFGGGQ